MSEHLLPNSHEDAEAQIITPNGAINDYLQIGPLTPTAEISLDDLTAWSTVLAAAKDRLTPEQQYHSGWINVEKAHGEHDLERPSSHVQASLDQAREHFSAVREKPGYDRVFGAYALGAAKGIGMYEGILGCAPDESHFEQAWNTLYEGQHEFARELLKNYERFGNISDVPGLHAAMTALLITIQSGEGIFCLPAPSRATHAASDAKNAWSLLLWDTKTDRLIPARIAATGPATLLNISPALLKNGDYASKHGQGTLQALIDHHNAEVSLAQPRRRGVGKKTAEVGLRQLLERRRRTTAYLLDVRGGVMAAIIERINRTGEDQVGEIPEGSNPSAVYVGLDPHLHPTALDTESLDRLISDHEITYSNGELSPEDMRMLAWMHIEMGVKNSTEREVSGSLAGAFDRAQDVCSDAATIYRRNEQSGLESAMMMARAASPIYKAVALHESGQINMHEVTEEYMGELVILGAELLSEFEQMTDMSSQEAVEAYQALQLITACLVMTRQSNGSAVAAVSSPRQRGEGHEFARGWDITVWPLNQAGNFMPDYYGRIRLDDKENAASVDENVLTVSGRRIDNDNSFAVLRNLIKQHDGKPIKPQAQQRIDKLAARLLTVAAAAEW